MSLLPVEEAVARLLAGVEPLDTESVPLADALGRVLAEPLAARRRQPPFPASAMDGYAVLAAEAQAGARLRVIGMSRAGARYASAAGPGEAVRIFTGAPVPDGADAVLIQENAERDGESIEVRAGVRAGQNIRTAGLDYCEGDVLLSVNKVLDSRSTALAASMGYAALPVRKRPRVAILSNGDELVAPGQSPGPDQIFSSNSTGLAAFVREQGGEPIDLGIAPDRKDEIAAFVGRAAGSDILVVSGGASVGEHDLVQAALKDIGMSLDFWRIALRPGKPLMVGRLGEMRVLGLPGNPVSTFVCGYVFLRPLMRAMLGLSTAPELSVARLTVPMPENDSRQDYVRARLSEVDGETDVTPFSAQDSSMLATFVRADALVVRPPGAPAAASGDRVPILRLGNSSAL